MMLFISSIYTLETELLYNANINFDNEDYVFVE